MEIRRLNHACDAAYVHVPFCRHRCGYCDFTLVAGRDELIDAYLTALSVELSTLEAPRSLTTLYIGGGTPTHLSAGQLRRLMQLLVRWFHLSEDYEWTVEANPADITAERAAVLAEAGVNRVSLGAQSFDAHVLTTLERDHLPEDVEAAVDCLRPLIPNLSIDLIFGVPGQSEAVWRDTLQCAVGLQPQHISAYGLTYEKGTAFWTRRQKGQLKPAGDDAEYAMYAEAMDWLAAAGYEQYEISSYAQPGFRSRHNQVYWTGRSYFGFGPGAARYLNGRRETNHRSVTTWLKRIQQGLSPTALSEELDPEDRARELAVLMLRRAEGISLPEFAKNTGYDARALAGNALDKFLTEGLVELSTTRLKLTRAGRFLADSIVVAFL